MTDRKIRIGGASGYWGDSQEAPKQLVLQGNIDYLVFDYLAEVTMSILVRAKEKNPQAGYARDFVDLAMKPLLHEIKSRGIKVVANAGGVNVKACADALAKVSSEAGIKLKIATVEGDDVMPRLDELRQAGTTEMFTEADLPNEMISANAYLGAFPIAAALAAGADVVITGRCVDSAVTLGACIHEFGWTTEDHDKLAAGTLAGHIIECGAQATGGNFTDWRDVKDDWDNMGYPIAECSADGNFIVCKPDDTGGLVSRFTVGEQILYEIGDPSAYIVPDVVCDFTGINLDQVAKNQVKVSGVKGRAPTRTYKVSSTYRDGYRSSATTVITGFDVVEKAQAFCDALLKRTRRLFLERNIGDYRDTSLHLIGAQTLWGDNATPDAKDAREVLTRIDVFHDERDALELFSKEATGVGLSMTTGRAPGGAAGRPKITPVVAQFAFLVDKSFVAPVVHVDDVEIACDVTPEKWSDEIISRAKSEAEPPIADSDVLEVPLIDLAVARSGDKGNNANVGVMARSPELLPYIRQSLTEENVHNWFSHYVKGEVIRFEAPGMDAMNFLLTDCLGGGGTSSRNLDSQAKTYGQQILAMPVRVPRAIGEQLKRAG
jgi:hypothetical protein